MFFKRKSGVISAVLGLALAGAVWAQDVFKYTGCTDVTRSNFTKVPVLNKSIDPTLDEIVRFVVAADGSVYFNERNGNLKVVKPGGQIKKLGKINVYPPSSPLKTPKPTLQSNHNNEYGLVGLALDPNFAANHYIYVAYQSNTAAVSNLSRFTVNSDVLDPASEKVILSWTIQQDYCCHTGGDIRFDAKGDLWMSIGNNTMNANTDADTLAYVNENLATGSTDGSAADDQGHAANSNDLRGKIIRIHPLPDGSYTIPAGNLKDAVATMYSVEDLAKIRPEIYSMGHRNPYTISVDDVKGLLTWGDVGPDNQWETEEYNLIAKPGFMGWPYFVGAENNPHYRYRLNKDPAGAMNMSKWNTGVQKLPPAVGAAIGYVEACAITGPIVRWTAAQTNPKKLPPHFDGKWLVTDWLTGNLKVISLDSATNTKVTAKNTLLNALSHPLELFIAPDGVLYIMEYGTGYKFEGGVTPLGTGADNSTAISRLEYSGASCLEPISIKDRMFVKSVAGKTNLINLGILSERSVTLPFGAYGFKLYDLTGKMAWEFRSSDMNREYGMKISIPASMGEGIYRANFVFQAD